MLATPALNVPLSVVKATATPTSTLPFVSRTVALIVDEPPLIERFVGLAAIETLPTAAAPTLIFTRSTSLTVAPPETAPIDASPDWPPAWKRTVAVPAFVLASRGSIDPRVVVNVTSVPFCTGVPACSITVAMMSAVPFACTMTLLANSVMVDWLGASSGTLSHADADNRIAHPADATSAAPRGRRTAETRDA